MNNEETHDENALRLELRQAREKLEGLVGELRAVDDQLEGLATERRQYQLLQNVCGALDELTELGAADLFWSVRSSASGGTSDGALEAEKHLRLVRSRVDHFEKRLGEIEDRRQSIYDEIVCQEDAADLIAGDVLEAQRLEELRKLEWEIERDVDTIPIRMSVMPWARGGEDDERFRRSLAGALLLSLLIAFLMPLIDIPLPERWEILEEQDRLTSLIREELPPPVPVVAEEAKPVVPEEPTSSEETPVLAEERAPEPSPEPTASKDAGSKGILAFREKFSGLAQDKAADRLGSKARIQSAGDATIGLPERSLVTTSAPGSSGGINIASLSRDVGGGGQGMGGVDVVRATSSIGNGNGTGSGSDRPLSGGPGLSRTDEEIQIVFDRHKSALYRLYNRELRQNPTLKGQMVLRMTIEPDGSVSMCELKSTDMKSQQLSAQVIERVKTFDFGAKEGISAVTIVYPIDFLPAT